MGKRLKKSPSKKFWKFADKYAKKEHWFIGRFLGDLQEAWEAHVAQLQSNRKTR